MNGIELNPYNTQFDKTLQEKFKKKSPTELLQEKTQEIAKDFFDKNSIDEALEALNSLKTRKKDECLINIAVEYATDNNLDKVIVVINKITKDNKDTAINKTARVFVDKVNYKTANELIDLSNDPDTIICDIALDVPHFRKTFQISN
jgi:hypothetical protein